MELSRRRFLCQVGGLTVASAAIGSASASQAAKTAAPPAPKLAPGDKPGRDGSSRAKRAEQIRRKAARDQRKLPPPENRPNGDETRHAGVASFGKGLPHNNLGEVEPSAFAALVGAIETGRPADFEAVPMGGSTKLQNPQAAFAFDLQGPDAHALSLPAPPAFSSAETGAEMVELYWQALTRDVPYADYPTSPLIALAAGELSGLTDFRGPRAGGRVTPDTIFRSGTAGDSAGPCVSQFLLRDIPFGAMTVSQRIKTAAPGVDFLTRYDTWLACQNGERPGGSSAFDPQPRYIRCARDLTEYVHRDYTYQPYMNAALILLGLRAPFDANNPYQRSATQNANATFGGVAVLDMVARIVIHAAKQAWYHKWAIHRRLRPEEYGGRMHNCKIGAASYPLHAQVLQSQAAERVFTKYGTYLLPMAYPEGCPVHPAYPAAHAVLAGAGATVLKAFFDESWVLPEPVVAAADGLSLQAWTGAPLTVGHEIDKLAGNIAIGRDAAGVHWRSDCVEGMRLGESLALNYLAESRALWNERFDGFSVTRIDGTRVTV
jgi:hypothetical protein